MTAKIGKIEITGGKVDPEKDINDVDGEPTKKKNRKAKIEFYFVVVIIVVFMFSPLMNELHFFLLNGFFSFQKDPMMIGVYIITEIICAGFLYLWWLTERPLSMRK